MQNAMDTGGCDGVSGVGPGSAARAVGHSSWRGVRRETWKEFNSLESTDGGPLRMRSVERAAVPFLVRAIRRLTLSLSKGEANRFLILRQAQDEDVFVLAGQGG